MVLKHHIVFVAAPSWGHCRPTVPISIQIVQQSSDVLVTIPVIGQYKDKMDKEIARYCTTSNSFLTDRIRIVQISDFDGAEFQYWDLIMKLWPGFFEKLWTSEPITCFSGRTYSSAPRPDLCIVDGTLSHPLGTSLIDGKRLKVLFWGTAGLSAMLSLFGPSYLGGFGDLEQDAKELAETTNVSIREATIKLFIHTSGKIRNIAGLPAAYEYEFMGEHTLPGAEELWIDLVKQLSKFLRGCDGLVVTSTPIVEEGAVKATKHWLDGMGKSFYALGPCMFPEEADLDHEESSRGQEVSNFLEKIYKHRDVFWDFHFSRRYSMAADRYHTRHGDTASKGLFIGSPVVYVFVHCHPLYEIFAMPHGDTYQTKLPNDLRDRLESSGIALVAKWAPQRTILTHPATGIFMTHGGQGGIIESLVSGVPMIVWPLQGDQPCNCMNLTLNLKVAYQLFEVRIGHGLKPLYRGYQPKGTKEAVDVEFRQVLKDGFGADGEIKRRVAQDLSKRLKEAWKEGGEAVSELRRMLQESFSYCS